MDRYTFVDIIHEGELTVQTHVDDKRVQVYIIFFDFPVEFQMIGGEILATDQFFRMIFMGRTVDAVIFLFIEMDDIGG